jgi:DNA-binding MarR family transcriptional regulator
MAQAGKAGKAGKTGKAGKAEKTTPEGELLFGILVDMLLMLHRVRALGRRQGAVSRWGGGTWGVLRSLAEEGPQTVPQLARARPVARQRIQKLADEMAADGLVEFVDNPAHRRSKLLRLTAAGFKRYDFLTARLRQMVEELVRDLSPRDLQATARVVTLLKQRLGSMLEAK